jgi:cation:H+ antiporter
MRRVFRSERGQQAEASLYKEQALRYQSLSLRKTYLNFAIAAVVIIGAAIWLAYIGDELASITGWGESFVGSLFLAIVSSLPEMAVCFAALRLGAIDMAVGDLLGSNMFNTGVIITAADLSYRQGPILASVSIGQAFSAFIAVLMTGVVVAALRFRPKRKVFRLVSWDAFVLIVLYLVGAYLFFITGSRI